MPKISVIIPVYNAAEYISESVTSILQQSYSDIQVICVDDGSKDDSGAILDKLAAQDNRLVVIHQQNAGVSASRNNALKVATGEYVMFVDADDWLDLDSLERTLAYDLKHDLDICAFSYISEHGKLSMKRALFEEDKVMDEAETINMARRIIGPIGEELKQPLMLDSYGTIWAKLYKKSVIDGIRFVNLKEIGTAEDSYFNMHAYKRAKKVGYLHQFFYHYRKTNTGAETKKYKPELFDRWKNQYRLIRENFTSPQEQQALQNRIAINTYGMTCNLMGAERPYRAIKQVLNDKLYAEALPQLQTGSMALMWRVFFTFVKYKQVLMIMLFHRSVEIVMKVMK